ncbi:collagen alpha-5(VI) chain [Elysia marginata]|uniref:Collagen alpha-5(VI) chain n=1 Tax=Elysia marginata TaxID=1093978 RepID=A0AAV4JG65_9GAST|nr:collagen alpha-5(VI) chain [Elysia marginata]
MLRTSLLRTSLLLLTLLCWGSEADQECGIKPADIVFINDGSGSVGSDNFQKTLRFIENVVNGLVIGPYDAQIGSITFESVVHREFNLNTYSTRQDVVNRVRATDYPSGSTGTDSALDFARVTSFTRALGMRPFAAQIAIVITDGGSDSPPATAEAAQRLREEGITIFAIGVGDGPDQSELNAIATDPDSEHVFSVDDFNSLSKIKESLQERACEAKAAFLCGGQADVVFLLEDSDNVGRANFNTTLRFVREVAGSFIIGPRAVQIAVDTFSSGLTHRFTLKDNNSKHSLKYALASMTSTGGVNIDTGNGIRQMRGESFKSSAGHRTNVPKIAVIVTSRQSTNTAQTLKEAELARGAGITLLAVGIGNRVDDTELQAIASGKGDQNVFRAAAFGSLLSLKGTVSAKLCGESKDDSTAFSTELACGSKADIVFIVDSTSGAENFELLKNFITNFVENLDIGQDKIRVAVVTFDARPRTAFSLNRYNTTEDLMEAIGRIEPMAGGRDMAAAISYVDTTMFKVVNGDRPGVPNIAIAMTNGPSTNPAQTKAAAERASANGITIFSLGVGEETFRTELNAMASQPANRHVLAVTDFTKLNSLGTAFKGQTCQAIPVTLPPDLASAVSALTLPVCKDRIPDCPSYSLSVCTGSSQHWGQENCRRYCGYCEPFDQILGTDLKCVYNGEEHDQGTKWDDGCLYECKCEDASKGQYTCYNKCPSYFNLPGQCTLTKKPEKCCLQPVCQFEETYTMKEVHERCDYGGEQYSQGEIWSVDCEFVCTCLDAATGYYACQSKCPKYESLPSNCKLVRSPGECCEKPDCKFETVVGRFKGISRARAPAKEKPENTSCVDKSPDCDKYEPELCSSPTNRSFALDNCSKFCSLCDPDKVSSNDVCTYKGQAYEQDDTWQDGCEKTCWCDDAQTGETRCEDLCPDYLNVPGGCSLVEIPNQCCKSLSCGEQPLFAASQVQSDTIGAVPNTVGHSTLPPALTKPSEMVTSTSDYGSTASGDHGVQLSKITCDPVEEGQSTTLTCSADLESCPYLFKLNWKTRSRDHAFCTHSFCGIYRKNVFEASISTTNSTLTINAVSRSSPFNMETKWTCAVCGSRDVLECDKLQVYVRPESPTCTLTEDTGSGEVTSVTVSCSTDKVYQRAKCSFYTVNNNSDPVKITKRPDYSNTETGGTPVYYRSQCSVRLSVEELGEGTHSFLGYIYPDVTGGESLVDGITPGKTVALSFPGVSHYCVPGMVDGYFQGNSSRCICNATSDGYPRGAARWYAGHQEAGKGGVLDIAFDENCPHKARATNQSLRELRIQVLPHPAYSSDLAPCDFWLFPILKDRLAGRKFDRIQDLAKEVNSELPTIPEEDYQGIFRKWQIRLKRCIESHGEYFEGL